MRSKYLFSLLLLVSCAVATASVVKMSDPRILNTLGSWASDSDEIRDVAVDAAGNRYVVGTIVSGATSNAFIAKTTRGGALLWQKPIDVGIKDEGAAVAVDAAGSPHIAINVDGTPQIQKFSTTGVFTWSAVLPYTGSINDIVIDSMGRVVSAGDFKAGAKRYMGVVQWALDGSGPTAIGPWEKNGTLVSLLLDNLGNVYAAGYANQVSATKGDAWVVKVLADFSDGTAITFGDGPSNVWNERATKLVQGPDGMLVFCGHADDPATGQRLQFYGTWNFGTDNGYYDQIDWTAGSTNTDVEVSPDGRIYIATTWNLTGGGRFADVSCYTKDPFDDWFAFEWYDLAWPVTKDADLNGYNLEVLPDGSIALAALDTSLVTRTPGSTQTYQAYQMFVWAPDGTRLHRAILGGPGAPIPADYSDDVFARYTSHLLYNSGRLTLAAPVQSGAGSHGAVWSGVALDGPDDAYTLKEDQSLSVSQADGLLANDPNGFDLSLRTVKLHGAKPASLATLKVRSGGAFEVTPVANYNGVVTFQYDVVRNAAVVGTHTVTLTVTPVKDPPVAVDDAYTVAPATKTFLDVLANDSDADGDTILVRSVGVPSHGTARISLDRKSVVYRPADGYTGPDSLTYTIGDGTGLTATATVTLTVQ